MKALFKKAAVVLLVLMTVFVILTAFGSERNRVSAASTAQDVIEDYSITVDVNNDGSLNMDYSITWHIISNGNEGPLTWVKIGVPNSDVDNIKAQSDNIKKIEYYEEGNEKYIKITFDQAYSDGDTFTFRYTFTQYNMFEMLPKAKPNRVQYWYTPGWFNDIEVRNITIRWNADKVRSADEGELVDGYYVWTDSLAPGERIRIYVNYDIDALGFQEHSSIIHFDVVKDTLKILGGVLLQPTILIVIVLFAWLMDRSSNKYQSENSYYRDTSAETDNLIARLHGENVEAYHDTTKVYSGDSKLRSFRPAPRPHSGRSSSDYHDYGSGGGFDGGSSSCACACACACAGGGRAGCSAKDLYGTKLESARIRRRLRSDLKEKN